tara:strand:- start:85 stop:417 length:333 start_codon:yes stop_codon:yes gene_type:complete
MKRFRQYIQDQKEEEILTSVAKEKKSIRHKDHKHKLQINEVSIKPNTARIIAITLISRLHTIRNKIKSEKNISNKINNLTDLIAQVAYLEMLSIATDQNDPNLLRKIPKK